MPRPSRSPQGVAFVSGRASSLDDAIVAAANLLGNSHAAVIAGLATDIAGAQAAIALAERIGAAIDHSSADAMLRDLEVMRQAGWIITTPLQARARADVVFLVGPIADDLPSFAMPPRLQSGRDRRIIHLCPGHAGPCLRGAATVGDDPAQLPVLLGVLRALVAGHTVRPDAPLLQPLRECATHLLAAAFGVAAWSASSVHPLSIEMLCGLIGDLNQKTRFTGLPLPPADNAIGVLHAAAWATGFPPRTGFARSEPEHDPWRFDAARMVNGGEADAALWISALSPEIPRWRRQVPLVALVAPGAQFRVRPDVLIIVGRPGIDHPSVLFDARIGALACSAPLPVREGLGEGRSTEPRRAAAVADVVHGIIAVLPSPPC
ncbi:MAG: hypothetical protein ACREF3_18260 [Acetobacteraceae bacterium]